MVRIRARLAVLIGGAGAVAIFFIFWYLEKIPTEEVCTISEGTKHCDRYNVFFAALWKLAKAIDPWGALITAIATGFIAWFTASIRRVNHNQLVHSRVSDRAYISGGGGRQFRKVKRGKDIFIEDTGRFEFHISNFGKTPGKVYAIAWRFFDESIPLQSDSVFDETRYIDSWIEPGRTSVPIDDFSIPSNLERPAIYGRVYYRTVFYKCYSSGFVYRLPAEPGSVSIRPPSPSYTAEKPEECPKEAR